MSFADAMAGVRGVRNPVLIARAVMEKSEHAFLIGAARNGSPGNTAHHSKTLTSSRAPLGGSSHHCSGVPAFQATQYQNDSLNGRRSSS
jgi:Asparaginase